MMPLPQDVDVPVSIFPVSESPPFWPLTVMGGCRLSDFRAVMSLQFRSPSAVRIFPWRSMEKIVPAIGALLTGVARPGSQVGVIL